MSVKSIVKESSTALFDPITTEVRPVEISFLMELLEKSRGAIDSLKHRRAYVKTLGAHIVPTTITTKEKRELMAKLKLEQEHWKPYPFNPRYLVSNYGRVQGLTKWGSRVFMVGTKCSNGKTTSDICCTMRTIDGQRIKKRYAHIVMETYSPKPKDGKDWVCAHKDLNIWNNRRDNLEWMTRLSFNRWVGRLTNVEIPVVKYDVQTGEELDEYRSISEAARQNFMSTTAIYLTLKGVQEQGCGFGWRISDDYELKKGA